MTANRFTAESNQTRARTWCVRDRATGAVVMDHLPPAAAKDWARSMNADQCAGRMIGTLSGEIEPINTAPSARTFAAAVGPCGK